MQIGLSAYARAREKLARARTAGFIETIYERNTGLPGTEDRRLTGGLEKPGTRGESGVASRVADKSAIFGPGRLAGTS